MTKKWIWILGILLGLIATGLVNWHLFNVESAQKSKAYIRLNTNSNYSAGDRLTESDLVSVLLPEKFGSIESIAVKDTPENRTWLLEQTLKKDVTAGDFLLHSNFIDDPSERFAMQISEDMRAIALSVTPVEAVAFFVEPGSHVDIIGTFIRRVSSENAINGADVELSRGPSELGFVEVIETKMVLQNVKVLAVDQATTRGRYLNAVEDGFRTITVEVSPEDAEKLVFARTHARGGLSFVLRNPGDEKVVELPAARWSTLD